MSKRDKLLKKKCLGMVILSNIEDGSASFNKFLKVLGDKVALKKFHGFKAGLDTENGQTGEYTINTKWRSFEITYHVSTLLPYFPGDEQQIQRKRHIGNDLVCLVFLDGNAQFDPKCIRSQFLQAYIIVQADYTHGVEGYKVTTVSSNEVPYFGPSLTNNGYFNSTTHLREFLLSKRINN